ncbi:hypothetical protein PVA45_00550 [Entomospira entomophila]|uniref:DUF4292 domain-containing protein n=1 Tax=Entomospira entomophila TaxID=2719988 RepID=A0A968G8N1_9SPIO|nr:hypothetical protein [Entomospira entomophilus]NIZ40011.1 hypothetical protein [Entomospira entomophilus]WDI35571.1 hypothetical protein PVA45_00550 [Entomospira entomophilus]
MKKLLYLCFALVTLTLMANAQTSVIYTEGSNITIRSTNPKGSIILNPDISSIYYFQEGFTLADPILGTPNAISLMIDGKTVTLKARDAEFKSTNGVHFELSMSFWNVPRSIFEQIANAESSLYIDLLRDGTKAYRGISLNPITEAAQGMKAELARMDRIKTHGRNNVEITKTSGSVGRVVIDVQKPKLHIFMRDDSLSITTSVEAKPVSVTINVDGKLTTMPVLMSKSKEGQLDMNFTYDENNFGKTMKSKKVWKSIVVQIANAKQFVEFTLNYDKKAKIAPMSLIRLEDDLLTDLTSRIAFLAKK